MTPELLYLCWGSKLAVNREADNGIVQQPMAYRPRQRVISSALMGVALLRCGVDDVGNLVEKGVQALTRGTVLDH
jgi:hypothetical protein